MKIITKLSAIAVMSLFVGCGGSGGGDKSTPKESNEATNPSNPPAQMTLKNAKYIKGMYDISATNDRVFLFIDDTGLITTYALNSSQNCYDKNPTTINNSLNGQKVSLDETNKRFTLNNYYWTYGNTTMIQNVSLGGTITSGGILSINNTRIATTSKLTTSPTKGEAEQSLCN